MLGWDREPTSRLEMLVTPKVAAVQGPTGARISMLAKRDRGCGAAGSEAGEGAMAPCRTRRCTHDVYGVRRSAYWLEQKNKVGFWGLGFSEDRHSADLMCVIPGTWYLCCVAMLHEMMVQLYEAKLVMACSHSCGEEAEAWR